MDYARQRENGDTIAASVRAARAYAGLSQREVAEILGVSRSTISAWERGETEIFPPTRLVEVIERLADLSGIPRSVFGPTRRKDDGRTD